MKRWPWLLSILAAISAFCIRCWIGTMRLRLASADGREHPSDPADERFLYCFWHEGLLAPLATPAKIEMLISQHADAELIAQICQWLGFGVLRGSSTRGGCEALLTMIRGETQNAHLGITPDGPRGPRRRLQPGAILVASLTGLPIVPIGIGFTSAWRANSWDQFAVPCPFTTLVGYAGEPLTVPPNLDRAGIELQRQRVEAELLRVTELAEDWAIRLARDGNAAPPTAEPERQRQAA